MNPYFQNSRTKYQPFCIKQTYTAPGPTLFPPSPSPSGALQPSTDPPRLLAVDLHVRLAHLDEEELIPSVPGTDATGALEKATWAQDR